MFETLHKLLGGDARQLVDVIARRNPVRRPFDALALRINNTEHQLLPLSANRIGFDIVLVVQASVYQRPALRQLMLKNITYQRDPR